MEILFDGGALQVPSGDAEDFASTLNVQQKSEQTNEVNAGLSQPFINAGYVTYFKFLLVSILR